MGETLNVTVGHYALEMVDESLFDPASTDNASSYQKELLLCRRAVGSSRHGVTCRSGDAVLSSTIVLAGGGASGVNAHSLVALESRCFVAVGDHLLCLNIPALDLVWKVIADDATVFGIHFGHGHEYLIVHGELAISRVSLAGVVEWSRSGADVFSGDLRLEDSAAAVRDFAERLYRFRLSDGAECG